MDRHGPGLLQEDLIAKRRGVIDNCCLRGYLGPVSGIKGVEKLEPTTSVLRWGGAVCKFEYHP